MNYKQAVAEGRRLVKRSEEDQWALAELTADVLTSGKKQREWATDIGIAQSHVSVISRVWERFGDQDRNRRPRFNDAYATVSVGSEQVVRASEVRSLQAQRQLPTRHEDRVQVATQLLSDPKVARSVAKFAASTPVVRQAVRERDQEQAAQLVEPRKQHQEARRGTDLDFSRIIVSMINVHHTLNRNLDLLRYHDLDQEQRDEVLEMTDRIETSLGWMVSFAKSGSRSFDDELDALLGGGA